MLSWAYSVLSYIHEHVLSKEQTDAVNLPLPPVYPYLLLYSWTSHQSARDCAYRQVDA